MIWRVLLLTALFVFIALGVRKIYRDWTGKFKADDEEIRRLRRERDLRERDQPGVIDLTRDKDGTFRPGNRDSDRRG